MYILNWFFERAWWSNGLTGLVADGTPVNMLITFTGNDDCAFAAFDAWTARPPCPCSMSLEVDNVGACAFTTGTYDLELTFNVSNPPGTGLLNIGGNLFEAPNGPGSYSTTITGLTADGQVQSTGAFFTDLPQLQQFGRTQHVDRTRVVYLPQ